MPGDGVTDNKFSIIASIASSSNYTEQEKEERISRVLSGTGHTRRGSALSPSSGKDKMDYTQKRDLITSNLQEVMGESTEIIMKDAIEKQKRPLRIYWGTATTGRPHCGYFVSALKIAEFLRAGCHVKILLADIHGFLDNLKAPIELVEYRAQYYKFVISEVLKAVGVSLDRLEFVLGSSFQKTAAYQMDLLKLCTMVTVHDARRAGADVVKQVENATLSGLIYPLMQSLDEQYLDVDVQFGGIDQRKIFVLAKDILPQIGYKERGHLMNPMVPGLTGGKMSASDPDSKLDVLDDAATITKKIKKAFAVPRQVENNGLLSFVQFVLLPASTLKTGKPSFVVERRDEEPIVYETIQKMHEDYAADILTPQQLKAAVGKTLNELLEPIQKAYSANTEWQKIAELAYPPPPEEAKKPKKPKKDKGTKAPSRVEAQPDGHVEGPDKQKVDVGASAEEVARLKVSDSTTNGAS